MLCNSQTSTVMSVPTERKFAASLTFCWSQNEVHWASYQYTISAVSVALTSCWSWDGMWDYVRKRCALTLGFAFFSDSMKCDRSSCRKEMCSITYKLVVIGWQSVMSLLPSCKNTICIVPHLLLWQNEVHCASCQHKIWSVTHCLLIMGKRQDNRRYG